VILVFYLVQSDLFSISVSIHSMLYVGEEQAMRQADRLNTVGKLAEGLMGGTDAQGGHLTHEEQENEFTGSRGQIQGWGAEGSHVGSQALEKKFIL
jgi:hypothetical protein